MLATFAISCAATSAADFSLAFWAGPSAEKDPRVSEVEDHHACTGRVAIAKVERLPTSKGGPLEPEFVEELDNKGRVVRRWPMPVDSYVIGVKEASIFVGPFAHASGNSLEVNLNGTYAPAQFDASEPRNVECPGKATVESAYRRCFLFKDAATAKERLLTFQGPCT